MGCSPISLSKILQMVRHATLEGHKTIVHRLMEGIWKWGVYERSQEDSWLREKE